MSHPNPHHDPENVRTDDSKFAPKAKAKSKALRSRIDNPTEKALHKVFGGLHNERSNKRLLKKSKAYRIKHF